MTCRGQLWRAQLCWQNIQPKGWVVENQRASAPTLAGWTKSSSSCN